MFHELWILLEKIDNFLEERYSYGQSCFNPNGWKKELGTIVWQSNQMYNGFHIILSIWKIAHLITQGQNESNYFCGNFSHLHSTP